jgi:hypothetical protein
MNRVVVALADHKKSPCPRSTFAISEKNRARKA